MYLQKIAFLAAAITIFSVPVSASVEFLEFDITDITEQDSPGFSEIAQLETELLDTDNELVDNQSSLQEQSDAQVSDVLQITRLLNYPNPFRLQDGTIIGFYITQNKTLTLEIFDMNGNRIFSRDYSAINTEYNTIPLNSAIIGYPLSAGVYFYLLKDGDSVVANGKMGVLP